MLADRATAVGVAARLRSGRRPWRSVTAAVMAAVAVADIARPARPSVGSKVSSDGDAMPGPALPITSGRSNATARSGPARGRSRAPGRRARRGRVGGQPGQPLADDLQVGFVELLRARTTAANRKNARPSIRNTSPTDATFWMIGSGIGMTSPNGPRWSRKLASSGGGRT